MNFIEMHINANMCKAKSRTFREMVSRQALSKLETFLQNDDFISKYVKILEN